MGAWGVGPFDNDDASDWAYEFDGADLTTGIRTIADALDLGEPGAYVEAPDGAVAVAASTVITWMLDPTGIADLPYRQSVASWVLATRPSPSGGLLAAAQAALDRVRSKQSELAELWAETDRAQ